MITRIQIRRGTAAAWTAANPTLAAGEAGLETDTRKTKMGDGTTPWNSLAYDGPATTAAFSQITAAAAYMVPVPGGTPSTGATQLLHVTSTAGGDLTFAPAIQFPSDSAFTGTKPLEAGQLYIVKLQYSGTFWMLVSLVGGY